ncbi:MAG TPA: hypothetical protein VG013_11605 [Gemmataceae bacterium]|nr:hypothetical protein [Gemmataceae bacterium]
MISPTLTRLLWTAFCLLVLPAGPAGAAPAAMRPVAETPRQAATAPLADSLWQKVYGPLSRALGTQQRMIQFSLVIVALALFIIWWRK